MSTIKDYTDIGYSDFMQKVERNYSTVTEPEILSSRVGDFLDALDVVETIDLTHTTVALATWFSKTTQVNLKNDYGNVPPIGLAYYITGTGDSKKHIQLPYYKFKTTEDAGSDSFFATEVHRVFFYPEYIQVRTDNITSGQTYSYRIHILAVKNG